MDRQPLRILIVEGRECDADLCFRILGHRWPAARLTRVDTLRSALEYLSAQLPDAILLDLQLPDSTGLQTLSGVLELGSTVPVVVLTELNDEALGLQAIRMGAQDHLPKMSLTGDILERCLRYAIERMRLICSIRQRDAELAHLSRLIILGEMASGLVHEVKQPLTAINNYAEATIHRLRIDGEAAIQRVTENLSAISQQASHAGDILRHMKSFVESSIPNAEAASLNQIICDCLALLNQEVRQGEVDVALQLDPQLPPVWVDQIQIKQVVLNLIRNAIEAVSAPRSMQREIQLRTFVWRGREAVFVVSDTGPGIDPESAVRIFEPYYSTKEGGMGLGLSICSSIVETYGGRIYASRKPNGGAEFRIALPLAGGESIAVSGIPAAMRSETMRDGSTTLVPEATRGSA